jgi:hypothetical protein
MTSRARCACLLAALAAGCGNYSNEDLEFMNALPNGNELKLSIPPRSSAVTVAEEADLARMTHDVTTSLNGLVGAIVTIVDAVRTLSPTSRTSDSRTWGPYPAEKHPGWQVQMTITRDGADPMQLDYTLAFHRAGGPDTDWPVLLSGWFRAGQTARLGSGYFTITTAALDAEGFDNGFGMLDHMEATYDTGADPITITMMITNLPDPTQANAIATAGYQYAASQDGRHQMTFDLSGNVVPGPLVEAVRVTSQWLDSGEGTGMLTVLSGDAAGSTEDQCWNQLFQPIYSRKAWATPAEDIGTDRSVCASISPLF